MVTSDVVNIREALKDHVAESTTFQTATGHPGNASAARAHIHIQEAPAAAELPLCWIHPFEDIDHEHAATQCILTSGRLRLTFVKAVAAQHVNTKGEITAWTTVADALDDFVDQVRKEMQQRAQGEGLMIRSAQLDGQPEYSTPQRRSFFAKTSAPVHCWQDLIVSFGLDQGE